MFKKISLLLVAMMGLFFGSANAVEVQIGSGDAYEWYLPTCEAGKQSYTQQLYFSEEIGMAGYIQSISFRKVLSTSSFERRLTIYLKHTDLVEPPLGMNWIPVTEDDQYFYGTVTFPGQESEWFTIELDEPFMYNGTDNLLIAVFDNTDVVRGRSSYYVFDAPRRAKYYYVTQSIAQYPLDPTINGSMGGSLRMYCPQIRMNIHAFDAPELVFNPETIDLGERPNNAWGYPVELSINNLGLDAAISAIESSNPFFTILNNEAPFTLGMGQTVTLNITNNGITAPGATSGQLVMMYDGGRTMKMIPMTASVYDPVCPDVYELAREVETFPYAETVSGMHHNYRLPGEGPDGNDAVYKMTFVEDVVLNAGVTKGKDAKMALYTEDFFGYDGPDAFNNYTAPLNGGGTEAKHEWLHYDSEHFEMTVGGALNFCWAVRFTPEQLTEYDGCKMTKVAVAVTEDGYYTVRLYQGGEETTGTLLHEQTEYLTRNLNNLRVINLDEYIDLDVTEPLWVVMSAPEIIYPAVVGFEINPDHNGRLISADGGQTWDDVWDALGLYMALKVRVFVDNGRDLAMRDRNNTYILDEAFNSTPAGWTLSNDWKVASFVNGFMWMVPDPNPPFLKIESSFMNMDGTVGYATTPAFNTTEANSLILDYNYSVNAEFGCNAEVQVFDGANWVTVADYSEMNAGSGMDLEHEVIDLSNYSNENLQVRFYFNDHNGFGNGFAIDDVRLMMNDDPLPNLIEDMTLSAGTYYLVASSTSETFSVSIDPQTMPLPEQAYNPTPADGAIGQNHALYLKWNYGKYTTGYRVLLGTTYPPTDVVIDWTDDLDNVCAVEGLLNNKNYFWRVDTRNSTGITTGQVWGFTTNLNKPMFFSVADNTIFEGETAHFSWAPVEDRSHRGYNIYQDGVKINNTPVSAPQYDLNGLTYNMEAGYSFYVTAVYDEGESPISNQVKVYVSGNGTMAGRVFEQDGVTPIDGATISLTGVDEFGVTCGNIFYTDANGSFVGDVKAGAYKVLARKDGYQDARFTHNVVITYDELNDEVVILMNELFNPIDWVVAEEIDDNSVLVSWGYNWFMIEDFETGDFSMYDWNNTISSYPWEITTTHPYEGTYCMQSGNYNIASSTSAIEVTVDITRDGLMSFYGMISCESSFDNGYFYIDGTQMGTYTGAGSWGKKEYPITEGVHTFKWAYTKDSSVNSNEDRFYVDLIDFVHDAEPLTPGWHTYCASEFNNAVGSNLTTTPQWGYRYPTSFTSHMSGWKLTKVALFSDNMYSAVGGNYTCTVYVGGDTPDAGSAVSTITVDVPANQNAWVEYDLTTPVNIDGTQNLWVIWKANSTVSDWPAGCCGDIDPSNDGTWWEGGSGWEHLDYGDWTMKNYFTDRGGRTVAFRTASEPLNTPIEMSAAAPIIKGNGASAVVCNPDAKPIVKVEGSRSMAYYNVYRTNCYTNVFTTDNLTLVASHITDTTFMDMEWGMMEAGTYKWGVTCVYEGNRETPIQWNQPVAKIADEDRNSVASTEFAPRNTYSAQNVVSQHNALRGVNAYSICLFNEHSPLGLITYDVEYPYESEGINTSLFMYGGDFCAADGYLYATYNDNTLYKIDITTGEVVNYIYIGNFFVDCAYDYNTNTMYGVVNGYLYTINVNTGSVTEIGDTGLGLQTLACDPEGQLYGVVNPSGNLYRIDPQTAVPTLVGATGMACSYVQSMGFDHDNGKLYWCGFTELGSGFFAEVNPENGQTELIVSRFGEQTCFFIPSATLNPFAWNESSIVVSNCLDKDMTTTVDITVSTDSDDSPEGAMVRFTNLTEPHMGYDVEVELDETGYYAWEDFRKGDYLVSLSLEGFNCNCFDYTMEEPLAIYDATSLECVLEEIVNSVGDLYVSATGWAQWGEIGQTPAGPISDWIYYDNGVFVDAIGGPSTIYWGISFTPAQLAQYDGCTLTKVAMFDNVASNYTANIYQGGYTAPQTLVATQNFTTTGTSQMVEVNLTSAPVIDASLPLWITFYYTGSGYPCAACDDQGNANARWISTDGLAWEDMASYGLNYTFMIRGFVTNEAKGGELVALEPFDGEKGEGNFTNEGLEKNVNVGVPQNDTRSILSYKVMIDDTFAGNSQYPFFQHNVEGFEEGSTHVTSVAAVYSTGISDFTEFEWVYSSCENYAGLVSGPEVTLNGNDAIISWELPNGGDNLDLGIGNQANRDGQWMYYDNGTCTDNIGAGGECYWGIMLPATNLTGYGTLSKVAVYANENTTGSFDLSIAQGGSAAPQTVLYTETFTPGTTEQFYELTLSQAVTIDPSQNLWITLHSAGATYPAAASTDVSNDPNGRWVSLDGVAWQDLAAAGLPGYTFMVRAYLEQGGAPVPPTPVDGVLGAMLFRDGEWLAFVPATENSYTDTQVTGSPNYCVRVVYDGEMSDYSYYTMSCEDCYTITTCMAPANLEGEYVWNAAENFGAQISWTFNGGVNPNGFNVYRDGMVITNVPFTGATAYNYLDVIASGTYEYQVTAVYNDCESDYAMTTDLSANYVSINVTSVEENGEARIYPNPTNGNVTIEANGMNHITVVSALGQVVYDVDVEGEQMSLNMSQFHAGVYVVRIHTNDGMSVKRITVVK